MLRHNKFILGILALGISTSIINSGMGIKANAYTQQIQGGSYKVEHNTELPSKEAIDKNGISWVYNELNDGTIIIQFANNIKAHMEFPSQLNGKTVTVIGDVPQYPEFKDYLSADERMDHVIQTVKYHQL